MASLTPLSKVLIGLAVVGAMGSAAWNLVLKERYAQPNESVPAGSAQLPPAAPAVTVNAAPAESVNAAPAVAAPPVAVPPASARPGVAGLSAADNAEAGRKALEVGDHAQARTHLEAAVADGDGGAACLLGDMTLKGQGGLTASQDKAAALYQLAQSRRIICFASAK